VAFAFLVSPHPVSNRNSFDLIEGDLIVTAGVEARGAGGFVVGHLLRHFELAARA